MVIIKYSTGFSISRIITLNCSSQPEDIYCFPNPAANELNIDLSSLESNEEIRIELVSLIGEKVIVNKIGKLLENSNKVINQNLKNTQSGAYLVKVYAGEKVVSIQKIVKL